MKYNFKGWVIFGAMLGAIVYVISFFAGIVFSPPNMDIFVKSIYQSMTTVIFSTLGAAAFGALFWLIFGFVYMHVLLVPINKTFPIKGRFVEYFITWIIGMFTISFLGLFWNPIALINPSLFNGLITTIQYSNIQSIVVNAIWTFMELAISLIVVFVIHRFMKGTLPL